MMRIDVVSPRPDRAGRYTVHFSDGSVIRLYRQTIQDFNVYQGAELTQEAFERLITAAGEMSAKMRAVRIVSATSVSRQELEQRLIHKGEDPAQAQKAVEWMSDLELLDDHKTAEQIVHRCISKGYGIARAKQALYEKRIPKEYWQSVLADYPDQTDAIVFFLRARLEDPWDARAAHKATDALLRRGHSYTEIRRAFRLLSLDDDFSEEYEWQR